MSEYQYYEFQAVDRLLDSKARAALRAISSRARITASSFVNHYDWGDLKADPLQLLERHFDLFLYLANWGTRQFAIKLPKEAVDVEAIEACQFEQDLVVVRRAGEHVVLSMVRDEIEVDEEWDDGNGWLTALAPLRGELLAGDLRLLPLLWLIQVENKWVEDDDVEPAPGLGPLTPPLAALSEFLWIDPDLLEAAGAAAAETPAEPSASEVEAFVRALPEDEKVALLLRLHGGDTQVGAALRRRCRPAAARSAAISGPRRTAGELRAAARRLEQERRRLAEQKAAAEQRRREQEAAQARAKRVQSLAGREEKAWCEAETSIGRRNPKGYDEATALLADLAELADSKDAYEPFALRLAELRARHSGKRQFIGRLDAAGLAPKVPID